MDQITDFLADLPIGLIVFIVAILFSFFGKDQKQQAPEDKNRIPSGQEAPRPILRPDGGTFEASREERASGRMPGRRNEERRSGGYTFASDERRAREERERAGQDVLVFGGLDFGRKGSLFDEDGDGERDSQWGKTKYGFDESEWGSAFGDKKSSEPIIR